MSDDSINILEQEFLKDAQEGLDSVSDKKKLDLVVSQLNSDLQKKLKQQRARKDKRKLKDQPWIYFAVVLIILLVVIAYVVIKFYYNY